MNNEPVAWFEQDPDMKSIWYQADQDSPNAIPLYTHPVKELNEQFEKGFKAGKEEGWKAHKFHHSLKELTDSCGACGKRVTADSIHTCSPQLKELTDEEITKLHLECWDEIEFARAILRKAQE